MEAIFPISALQERQSEVKDAARKGLVHITENGSGAWVFCSEEVLDGLLRSAAGDAAYEVRMEALVARGVADVEAGRVYEGADAAFVEDAVDVESPEKAAEVERVARLLGDFPELGSRSVPRSVPARW